MDSIKLETTAQQKKRKYYEDKSASKQYNTKQKRFYNRNDILIVNRETENTIIYSSFVDAKNCSQVNNRIQPPAMKFVKIINNLKNYKSQKEKEKRIRNPGGCN